MSPKVADLEQATKQRLEISESKKGASQGASNQMQESDKVNDETCQNDVISVNPDDMIAVNERRWYRRLRFLFCCAGKHNKKVSCTVKLYSFY